MNERSLSTLDRVLMHAGRMLNTLAHGAQAERPSPAENAPADDLLPHEKRHAGALMRINHAGEICAQALYEGQALAAKDPAIRRFMVCAAREENDHLAWCEQRITQLGTTSSLLNPLWYSLSFGIGWGMGRAGDKINLGFLAATEENVCTHLQKHDALLPANDQKSRAIVQQMIEDERAHGTEALNIGGMPFPAPVKHAMMVSSRVMTGLSYYI